MGRVREKLKRLLTLSMTVAMMAGLLPGTVYAANGRSADALDKAYSSTGSFVKNDVKTKADAGTLYGNEWYIMGLARADIINHDSDLAKRYYYAAYDKVKSKGNRLSTKVEENVKVILALRSLGYDPENIAGYNLISGLGDFNFLKKDGITGVVYALIALNSGDYADPSATVTREILKEEIVNKATYAGGWSSPFGGSTDIDVTTLAMIALAPYYHKGDAKLDGVMDDAEARLSGLQNIVTGGFTVEEDGNKVDTCEASARVIMALTAIGINPDTKGHFIKNNNSLIDALLLFSVSGGGFKHKAGESAALLSATEQGYLALVSYYRELNGMKNLFDMSDVAVTKPNPSRPLDVKSIKFTKASVDITYDPVNKVFSGTPLELGNLLEITPVSGSKVKALGADVTQTWTATTGSSLVTLDKSTGRLTPKANANGTVKIKVTIKDTRNVSATANITVKITGPAKAKSVKVTYKKKTSGTIEKDASIVLTSTVLPTNAVEHAVTWKADKKSYVELTPSEDGKTCTVKGLKAGKIKITATAKDGSKKKATFTLTVKPKAVKSVTIDGEKTIKLAVGEKRKLTATVLPLDASERGVTWKSKSSSIVKIDAKGNITAKKSGTTKITVTTKGKNAKGKKLSKTITVKVE